MKKIILIASLLALLTGCTRSTQYGQCIGIADDKKPGFVYAVSYWNVFLAVIFSETLVVPVVVIAANLKCPIGTESITAK